MLQANRKSRTLARLLMGLFHRIFCPQQTLQSNNMPLDSRRLPVPSDSRSPYCLSSQQDLKSKILIKEDGNRQDGRTADQVRPLFIKAGVVTQAKGSAYIEMHHTKLICAVYGPREVTKREEFSMKGQLNCEFKFATFSCRKRRQHQQDMQEKEYSDILVQTLQPAVRLEKFPKARMDVFVTVLQDDGSALAAGMTCASLALADAGVEMYDLVIGCSLRQQGKILVLDPCDSEEYTSQDKNSAGLTVGMMPSIHQVAGITQKGCVDVSTLTQGMSQCISTCQKLYPVLQQCLVRAVKSKISDNNS